MPIQYIEFARRSVKLEILNADGKVVAEGSGFILSEDGGTFLYTAWHLLTGIDPRTLEFRNPPDRKSIRVLCQDVKQTRLGLALGGRYSQTIALYDRLGAPVWLQERSDIPNADLNAIQIRVPRTFDAVKIPIELPPHHTQILAVPPDAAPYKENLSPRELSFFKQRFGITPTEPRLVDFTHAITRAAYIAGFPYGFSASGSAQIDPVVLTRHIAHSGFREKAGLFYLDNDAAPSMSGSPVWIVEPDGSFLLVGIYIGSVFTDYPMLAEMRDDDARYRPRRKNDQSAALGQVAALAYFRQAIEIEWPEKRADAPLHDVPAGALVTIPPEELGKLVPDL